MINLTVVVSIAIICATILVGIVIVNKANKIPLYKRLIQRQRSELAALRKDREKDLDTWAKTWEESVGKLSDLQEQQRELIEFFEQVKNGNK